MTDIRVVKKDMSPSLRLMDLKVKDIFSFVSHGNIEDPSNFRMLIYGARVFDDKERLPCLSLHDGTTNYYARDEPVVAHDSVITVTIH